MGKIAKALIVSLVVLLVIGGVAYAGGLFSLERTFPGRATVVEVEGLPPENIGLYADQECTIPVETLDWGEIASDDYWKLSTFLKNEGEEPWEINTIKLYGSPGYYYWGLYDPLGYSFYGALAPGEVARLDISMYIYRDTPPGEYNFTVTIVATPATVVETPVG